MRRVAHSVKSSPVIAVAAACVVVASLYFARDVLIPLTLAVLLAFLLNPLVSLLEKWGLGRAAPVLLAVLVAMSVVGLLGWVLQTQFVNVANKLPVVREEIQRKIAVFRGLSGQFGEATRNLEKTVREAAGASSTQPVTAPSTQDAARTWQSFFSRSGGPALPQVSPQNPLPVRNYPEFRSGAGNVAAFLVQMMRPLATAGLVIVFAIFMLLKREDLRDRMIRLTSRGRVNFSTQAVNDAAARISRCLLAELFVNAAYGLTVAIGLWTIGITLGSTEGGFPSVLLWALLCGVLRFVPYAGPVIGAAFPLAIAFGFFHSNGVFLAVLAMFAGLEITVQFVEPLLYRSSTGISALAILVSAVFWTAVWGPIGLLLSMPLTVLLVVMGKYVPQLKFLDILLGDQPVLEPPERIYQRLLALDQEEAVELAQQYAVEHSVEALYEDVLIPVLAMSTHDNSRGELDDRRQRFIHKSLRVIVEELGEEQRLLPPGPQPEEPPQIQAPSNGKHGESRAESSGKAPQPPGVRVQVPVGSTVNVLVLPAGEEADEIAGLMLAQLLEGRGYCAVVSSASSLVSEAVAMVEQQQAHAVCVSAMPPGSVARARYLCKRLHEKHADLRVLVGLWAFRGELGPTNSRLALAAPGHMVINLREAQEQIDHLAQPFVVAGKATGDQPALLPS